MRSSHSLDRLKRPSTTTGWPALPATLARSVWKLTVRGRAPRRSRAQRATNVRRSSRGLGANPGAPAARPRWPGEGGSARPVASGDVLMARCARAVPTPRAAHDDRLPAPKWLPRSRRTRPLLDPPQRRQPPRAGRRSSTGWRAAPMSPTTYTPFKGEQDAASVRSCGETNASQLALFTRYSYHAFITDRAGQTLSRPRSRTRSVTSASALWSLRRQWRRSRLDGPRGDRAPRAATPLIARSLHLRRRGTAARPARSRATNRRAPHARPSPPAATNRPAPRAPSPAAARTASR